MSASTYSQHCGGLLVTTSLEALAQDEAAWCTYFHSAPNVHCHVWRPCTTPHSLRFRVQGASQYPAVQVGSDPEPWLLESVTVDKGAMATPMQALVATLKRPGGALTRMTAYLHEVAFKPVHPPHSGQQQQQQVDRQAAEALSADVHAGRRQQRARRDDAAAAAAEARPHGHTSTPSSNASAQTS